MCIPLNFGRINPACLTQVFLRSGVLRRSLLQCVDWLGTLRPVEDAVRARQSRPRILEGLNDSVVYGVGCELMFVVALATPKEVSLAVPSLPSVSRVFCDETEARQTALQQTGNRQQRQWNYFQTPGKGNSPQKAIPQTRKSQALVFLERSWSCRHGAGPRWCNSREGTPVKETRAVGRALCVRCREGQHYCFCSGQWKHGHEHVPTCSTGCFNVAHVWLARISKRSSMGVPGLL